MELWTQQNGVPLRKIEVKVAAESKRAKPGHFGHIEPANPEDVVKSLYPLLPLFD